MNNEQFNQWLQAASTRDNSFLPQPLIMGVLNVTPDSFSDGGLFIRPQDAYQQAITMVEQGADIIDVGGESTKPGVEPSSCDEELARVIPVIERLRANSDICISIDTYKADVMREAVAAGASFINDTMALTQPNALSVAAQLAVPVCLMHMRGVPKSMQDNPHYLFDVVDEINLYFKQRIETCLQAGIARHHLILDPGFGFGKSVEHNLQIVKRFAEFQQHQHPLLLGVSRKSTIGAVLQKSVTDRLLGGITLSVFAAMQGVNIIRTHDVSETKQALHMLNAVINGTN